MNRTPYEKINYWLSQHEACMYYEKTLDQIADYIAWAAKFKKITDTQETEVVDRICKLYNP